MKDLRMSAVFSAFIKETRRNRELTQESMAELLGISARSYAELEHGRSLCGMRVFVKLMSILDREDRQRLIEALIGALKEEEKDAE